MPTKHLLIKGKVQGVFYRVSAKEVAEETGLTGWIKNTPEGNVEALVSGTNEKLEAFISWCKQGPDRAIVRSVDVMETAEQSFQQFVIRK